jgi:hypothetical protein
MEERWMGQEKRSMMGSETDDQAKTAASEPISQAEGEAKRQWLSPAMSRQHCSSFTLFI